MNIYTISVFSGVACLSAFAQVPTTIRVTNETVPPGGTAQIKVLLTSPKPIMSGYMAMDLSGVPFDDINGIALFSGTGDVVGAAVVNSRSVDVRFTSPNGTFGTGAEYPLLTIALTVSKSSYAGQKYPVYLDPSKSVWQDLLGPIPFEFQQGSITVGGSVSISNVVPGGGLLPAGGSFDILGAGFSPGTKATVRGLNVASIQYVSPTQLHVTLKQPGTLDGALIQVMNPDQSSDTYYSYLRGVSIGPSSWSLLNRTVPVFSLNPATEALFTPPASAGFNAIALQNPSRANADIMLESHAPDGGLLASMHVSLSSGARLSREISELFGVALPDGGYLRILSTQPVQMLGLLGDDLKGEVLPAAVTVLAAPAPPPPPDATPTGSGGKGK